MGLLNSPAPVSRDARWVALSDHQGPLDAAGLDDLIEAGTLVLELTPPKQGGAVLLDHRSDMGWPRALSIFQDAAAGIVILHRQGPKVSRHHLPGPLPRDWQLAQLTYTWNSPGRIWALRLADSAGAWMCTASGHDPMPMFGDDIVALCAGSGTIVKDPSVQWFGVCLAQPTLPVSGWIGQRTPIDTARGCVMAGDLRPGDLIATRDNGRQMLMSLHRYMLPNRGRFAPVLLRAPYFAQQTDILVGPAQLTLISGTAVEYLFGEEAILAAASSLRDGNSALSDTRRALTAGIILDLGRPDLVLANGCPLLSRHNAARDTLPYRLLLDYETLPLQSLLNRSSLRGAA